MDKEKEKAVIQPMDLSLKLDEAENTKETQVSDESEQKVTKLSKQGKAEVDVASTSSLKTKVISEPGNPSTNGNKSPQEDFIDLVANMKDLVDEVEEEWRERKGPDSDRRSEDIEIGLIDEGEDEERKRREKNKSEDLNMIDLGGDKWPKKPRPELSLGWIVKPQIRERLESRPIKIVVDGCSKQYLAAVYKGMSRSAITETVAQECNLKVDKWTEGLVMVNWRQRHEPFGNIETVVVEIDGVELTLKNVMVLNFRQLQFKDAMILGFDCTLPQEIILDTENVVTPFEITRIPVEVWVKNIFVHMDQKTKNAIRSTHPYIYGAISGDNDFFQKSKLVITYENSQIFHDLISENFPYSEAPQHNWNQLEFEIKHSKFCVPISDYFFTRFGNAVTKLELFDCWLGAGIRDEFYFSSIVDRLPNLLYLAFGGCPGFLDPLSTTSWRNITGLKMILDNYITADDILSVLGKTPNVVDLAVPGNLKEVPRTRKQKKMITEYPHNEKWKEDIKTLDAGVLNFVTTRRHTLRSLDFSYHPFFADSKLFKCVWGNDTLRNPTTYFPKLISLDLTMCNIRITDINQLLAKLPAIKEFSCTPTVSKQKTTKNCIDHDYITLLNKAVRSLTSLKVTNSDKFDCICFVIAMKELEHLDLSYNREIQSKHFYNLEQKGHQIKTFNFAGNKDSKLSVRQLFLPYVVHLDLSFSNCVTSTIDFNHICHNMGKLKVLKLSGIPGKIELFEIRMLQGLEELRLRKCYDIASKCYPESIRLPLLAILDVAETQLRFRGLEEILRNNTKLKRIDARGCSDVATHSRSMLFYTYRHVTILTGKLVKRSEVELPVLERFSSTIKAKKYEVPSIVSQISSHTESVKNKLPSVESPSSSRESVNGELHMVEQPVKNGIPVEELPSSPSQ